MAGSVLVLLGGGLIGLSAVLLWLTHGRIAGISGITGGVIGLAPGEARDWRLAFLGGLAATGLIARVVAPAAIGAHVRSMPAVLVAGLLVGFGARMGNGCTSGHGVCGIARLSMRSLVAIVTFIISGMIALWLMGVP